MRLVAALLVVALAGCLDGSAPETPETPELPASQLPLFVPADCDALAAPESPTGLTSTLGPGPGMTTLTWNAARSEAPILEHRITRSGATDVLLGNSLAFGDHAGTSRTYTVAAIDACGRESPPSPSVTGAPLPGQELFAVGTTPLDVASSELASWPIMDADSNVTGANATWRIVEGTGNCCENYVVTTPTGRIIDFGGTFLHYSDDAGITWRSVATPTPYVNGEGALVVGPNGDVLGVGWDPYSGDRLWSHKYVAADDQWYFQNMLLHQPFFDRAWITAVKGPFDVNGQTVPYLTFVESNFHGGLAEVLLRSSDGLNYVEFSEAGLGQAEGTFTLPTLEPDPERDWMQPISQAPSRPLGRGLALQQTSLGALAGCSLRALTEDGSYRCLGGGLAELDRFSPVLADAAGNLHTIGHEAFYSMSSDGGNTWIDADTPFPAWGLRVFDFKVHAGLDRAIVAAHATVSDGVTGDFLWVFDQVTTEPRFRAAYQVGSWDSGSDSGLGGDRRFDFMTAGFLPDGRVVMSFTDGEHHPPALAISQFSV